MKDAVKSEWLRIRNGSNSAKGTESGAPWSQRGLSASSLLKLAVERQRRWQVLSTEK